LYCTTKNYNDDGPYLGYKKRNNQNTTDKNTLKEFLISTTKCFLRIERLVIYSPLSLIVLTIRSYGHRVRARVKTIREKKKAAEGERMEWNEETKKIETNFAIP
jgi:hypothetical protein